MACVVEPSSTVHNMQARKLQVPDKQASTSSLRLMLRS